MLVYGGRRTREGRPRAWRTPAEGGTYPRAGRNRSREELPLERGGARPRGSAPSSEAEPARGGTSKRAVLVGRQDPRGVGRVLHG
jgi:hypothetical protein